MKRITTLVLYLAFTAGVFAIPFEAAFSVSADKQVVFSMGNLQHHPKNGEWRFAANQYDYLSGANANLAADYDGWVDMFRWSTDNPAALWGVSASTTKSDYLGNFVDWLNIFRGKRNPRRATVHNNAESRTVGFSESCNFKIISE